MAATLEGILVQDARRRREKAEQKRTEMPPEQLRAHNGCIDLLAELQPQAALAVVQRIARGIVEFIDTQARRGV